VKSEKKSSVDDFVDGGFLRDRQRFVRLLIRSVRSNEAVIGLITVKTHLIIRSALNQFTAF